MRKEIIVVGIIALMLAAVSVAIAVQPEDTGVPPEDKGSMAESDPSITIAGSRIQFLNFEIDGSETYTIILENGDGVISTYTGDLDTDKGMIRLYVVLFTYAESGEETPNGDTYIVPLGTYDISIEVVKGDKVIFTKVGTLIGAVEEEV
ncbi:MAG: hypothetical protein E4G94_00485 [ANME-2 cluster archaeon]|nr:MAG: hypothetical protein E4G94_00485 [ANME-2 cluster archaeon]